MLLLGLKPKLLWDIAHLTINIRPNMADVHFTRHLMIGCLRLKAHEGRCIAIDFRKVWLCREAAYMVEWFWCLLSLTRNHCMLCKAIQSRSPTQIENVLSRGCLTPAPMFLHWGFPIFCVWAKLIWVEDVLYDINIELNWIFLAV